MSHGLKVGSRHSVRVDKLAVGGDGLCRLQDFVLFIPLAVPGDELEIQITRLEDRHGFGEIVSVVKPGSGRRQPPCPYTGECGGCTWQQVDTPTQLAQKELILRDLFAKFLPNTPVTIDPIIASPRDLRYRNRTQPHITQGGLGFRKRKSHDLIRVEDCLITEEPLTPYFQQPVKGEEGERVELRLLPNGETTLAKSKDEKVFSFSQVNRFQNEQLVSYTLQALRGEKPSEVWDLYCGSGNFTFPLMELFPKTAVLGVEYDADLVQLARTQAAKNPHASFFVSDVQAWMRRKTPPKNSIVIVDPPRAGADRDVMRALAASGVSKLIYIACHPVSLVRDLKYFLAEAQGARIEKVQPFEMFPQTDHFETIAVLTVDSSL